MTQEFNDDEQISRSERKREAHAVTDLGERLVKLPDNALAKVPLSPAVAEALALARSIVAHGGRRRQIRYLGKLLRNEDLTDIENALSALDGQNAAATRVHHTVERWVARLLDEADTEALTEMKAKHPDADAQAIRQWQRNARREIAAAKPPHSRRALFRYVRELIGG